MNSKHSRLYVIARRTIDVLPILMAMWFHAIAMQRWVLIVPAAIALVFEVFRSSKEGTPTRGSTSRRWYGVVIAGLLVGMIVPAAEVTTGPLPPAGAAALTGIAVAVCLYAVFTCQSTVGWVAAWALITISGKMVMEGSLRAALLGFFVASLLAASFHAGLMKNRIREILFWGVLVATIGMSTLGVAMLIGRVDQLFLGTVERLMNNPSELATTGLSDSIPLAAKSTINPSKRALLDLSRFPGLLRVKVMDEFNDDQWTISSKLKAQTGVLDGTLPPGADSRSMEMLFLEDLENSIPSPAGTSSVRNASPRVDGGWILRGKPDGVAITIVSDSAQRLPSESIDGVDLLTVPAELNVALAPLAAELAGAENASNTHKARSIASFFQSNFEYSLTTDLSGDAHPLMTLIEQRRPAYCIYFASAMALMLRSQGVPTRIVSGFAPGEVNPLTGRVIVRASDAHAWVEVWSPEEERFVTFDPTPSSSRREIMEHSASLGFAKATVSALQSAFLRLWLLLRYQPSTGIQALLVSPMLWVGIGGLVWLWRKRVRRPIATRQSPTVQPVDTRLRKQYDRYWALLRNAGVNPQPTETDDELLERLEATGNQQLWESAKRFVQRYRGIRFGGQGYDESLDEFKAMR